MIVLKVKNLRLKYPNGDRKIFDNLNIEIKDKEKVLLLGPSGSGKSTLLMSSGIVPNLIELPMKYDELDIDPNSGLFFKTQIHNFVCQSLRRISFRLRKSKVPREDMDEQIKKHLRL